MYVDVHAHLDHKDFKEDLVEVLDRAKSKGLHTVIAQGINHESNQKVLKLAEEHELISAALGMYPSEASTVELVEGYTRESAYSVDTTLEFIQKNAKNIVAIGEVGLDMQECTNLDDQKEVFTRVVKLAKKLRKPLIVHSRKAEAAVLDVLDEQDYRRLFYGE